MDQRGYAPIRFLAALAVLLLGGCAFEPDWHRLHARAEAIQMDCYKKHSTYAAGVDCGTQKIVQLYSAANWPHMDLLHYQRSQLLAIAERFDRGEITQIQADAAFDEVNFRVGTETRRREEAENARRAAFFNAMNAAPSQPQPMTCYPVGAVTRCY